ARRRRHAPRGGRRAVDHRADDRSAAPVLPRARRAAKPAPRAGAGAARTSARELDAARLRHPDARRRYGAAALAEGARRPPHPAAPRRQRRAHARRRTDDPRRPSAHHRRRAPRGSHARDAPRGAMTEADVRSEVDPAPRPRVDARRTVRALVAAAALRYRAAGRFAYYFARGKLAGDPAFRAVLERGLVADGAVLDIGCGQGLLAAWL